jgi:hypothetical protein
MFYRTVNGYASRCFLLLRLWYSACSQILVWLLARTNVARVGTTEARTPPSWTTSVERDKIQFPAHDFLPTARQADMSIISVLASCLALFIPGLRSYT